ncbi:carbohydrate-binding family 9-like protein [Pseudotenacibaculum haliotis]|uniref:Carbohydrate-binding family 9-like protein n=1 Tax=Pseudotenacibaculum haliotis TaxID=1862138 RepID=A0ABW5LVW7_9FLAO
MKNTFYFFIFLLVITGCERKKAIYAEVSTEIVSPKTYVVYKTTQPITIDGKADESDWKNSAFTDEFIDIEGVKIPSQTTKVKMLWDANFLYVYAKLDEKHIWGDITKRDAVIFYNNDFEVFISPSDDTHNYGEIEINALGTVWDLILNKPYNVGGKPKNRWNLNDLKSAVFIKGSLNDPSDIDEYWSVELAIPLSAYAELKNRPKIKPKDGEQWRINFSRVQWDHDLKDGTYSRKKKGGKFLPEYNWTWSNQGAINMHLPENWGYIHFTDNVPTNPIEFKHQTDALTEQVTYALYRKIAFKDLKHLKKEKVGTQFEFEPIEVQGITVNASFLKTHTGFTLQTQNTQKNTVYTINETGLIRRKQTN